MIKRQTCWAIGMAVAGAIAFGGSAEAKTGSVRMQIYKAGFIVGVSGGNGTITLDKERTRSPWAA